jgi:hypothetical protein|tara:strand:+ start:385 stop:1647 length:1263 start_codon:yes stop_codon:yes gene_type:complete
MKKRLFPFLIALSALAVSGSAAFYSVFGLSKLFAGASTEVIIMAGSLEFAKLVVASLLYQYWDTINKFLRFYLGIACFILILITSGGIYGFLSGAYQSTATQSELLDKSLMILNQKQVRFEEQKEDLKIEKTGLTKSISDLRIALSNPSQIQYIDKESGTLITTSSSSARRALQNELTIATGNRDNINIRIEAVMDSINNTDMTLLDKEISNEAESELGPLKYLAETTGQDMGIVVNWFLLLIIFVFDPLAIALVIAANMAFAQIKKNTPVVKMSVPDGMKFNTPYPMPADWKIPSPELKQRVKDNQDKLKSRITGSIKIEKKDIIMDDLEDLPFEEEKWIDTQEDIKDKQIGLDAWIDVLEEEEAEQESPEGEHELYHGKEEGVTRRGESKKRTRKKVGDKKRIEKGKPPGYTKNYTNI